MHTSDIFLDIHNDGINSFTISNQCEMHSPEGLSSHGCLTWACFIFISHCDVTVRAERRTLRQRQRWLEAGDTDLTADNSASNIPWCDCYDLNDRSRMESDHVAASGAVVRRATIHEWDRPSLRYIPTLYEAYFMLSALNHGKPYKFNCYGTTKNQLSQSCHWAW